jgi:heat shock protein HtpX
MMGTLGFYVLIGVFIWALFSYFLGSKLMLAFAGAKPIQKSDHPDLYRSVENVSIAAGLPKTPEIYIIQDMSLNAFATGNSPKNAKVAISKGLLEKLSKPELEAVMAHEVGHILNRDIRVMLIATTFVGAIEMIGETLWRTSFLRSSSDRNNIGTATFIIGLLFITIGTLIGTLAKLAISREREFLADATSAKLTNNPLALVSALKKISQDARLEVLDKKASISGSCIADPSANGHKNHAKELLKLQGASALGEGSEKKPSLWSRIWSTHPPMSERIAKLQSY